MTGKVGTPAPPEVVKVLKVAHGFAVPVSPSADNGHPITNYRAQCTSSERRRSEQPDAGPSPIVVNKLTDGRTYVVPRHCDQQSRARARRPRSDRSSSARVSRREPPRPAPGRRGNVHATPGLLLSLPRSRIASSLGATFGSCSGPYVRAAGISVSFRTKSALSCQSVIGAHIGGSGTLTWTAPVGLGTSGASIHLVIGSTNGHTTTAHFPVWSHRMRACSPARR